MNNMNTCSFNPRKDLILGGLWGAVVGDALGVPVEFQSRSEVRSHPVTDMRGHGTYNQPTGTWSDDSSLLLCTADSLVHHEFDTGDMGRRFVEWYEGRIWTPWGKVFDVGMTTSEALARIANGTAPAELAGSDRQSSNGNGSLMRILPVALRFADLSTGALLDRVHRASAITHRHRRSQMACGFHSLVVRELLKGTRPDQAFSRGLRSFLDFYEPDALWSTELVHFRFLRNGNLANQPEPEIASSGYVIHTLIASLWCLLTTDNYRECVLKAVNLGGDTDTTGCVAGGLAGVAYGLKAIPPNWIHQLARQPDLDRLFNHLAERM